jgi:hypothetical protein
LLFFSRLTQQPTGGGYTARRSQWWSHLLRRETQHKTVPLARSLLPLRRDYCAAELKDKEKKGGFFFLFSLFIYLWLDSSRRRRRRRGRGIIDEDGDDRKL